MTQNQSALPDPVTSPDFYSGVAFKRFAAWCVDIVLIGVMTAVIATLPLFIGWFFFPVIFLAISLIYRILTIGSKSATWGMRLFNIELRRHVDAAPLSTGEAALHTIGFLVSFSFALPQLVSIGLMIFEPRGRSLHDLLTNTAMINRPSRF